MGQVALMNHFRQRYGTARAPLASQRRANCPLPWGWRFGRETVERHSHHSAFARDGKLARVEAILMMADEPITARRMAEVAGLKDAAEARLAIQRLQQMYDNDATAFQIEEIAGGYQLLTRPRFHPWLSRLKRTGYELKLSPALLETLAIIAYKQPIMRADIDAIRGVASGELVRQLMEKGLVRVVGRHESLGRPQLYGTTKRFLQAFALNTLDDLPEVESLRNPR